MSTSQPITNPTTKTAPPVPPRQTRPAPPPVPPRHPKSEAKPTPLPAPQSTTLGEGTEITPTASPATIDLPPSAPKTAATTLATSPATSEDTSPIPTAQAQQQLGLAALTQEDIHAAEQILLQIATPDLIRFLDGNPIQAWSWLNPLTNSLQNSNPIAIQKLFQCIPITEWDSFSIPSIQSQNLTDILNHQNQSGSNILLALAIKNEADYTFIKQALDALKNHKDPKLPSDHFKKFYEERWANFLTDPCARAILEARGINIGFFAKRKYKVTPLATLSTTASIPPAAAPFSAREETTSTPPKAQTPAAAEEVTNTEVTLESSAAPTSATPTPAEPQSSLELLRLTVAIHQFGELFQHSEYNVNPNTISVKEDEIPLLVVKFESETEAQQFAAALDFRIAKYLQEVLPGYSTDKPKVSEDGKVELTLPQFCWLFRSIRYFSPEGRALHSLSNPENLYATLISQINPGLYRKFESEIQGYVDSVNDAEAIFLEDQARTRIAAEEATAKALEDVGRISTQASEISTALSAANPGMDILQARNLKSEADKVFNSAQRAGQSLQDACANLEQMEQLLKELDIKLQQLRAKIDETKTAFPRAAMQEALASKFEDEHASSTPPATPPTQTSEMSPEQRALHILDPLTPALISDKAIALKNLIDMGVPVPNLPLPLLANIYRALLIIHHSYFLDDLEKTPFYNPIQMRIAFLPEVHPAYKVLRYISEIFDRTVEAGILEENLPALIAFANAQHLTLGEFLERLITKVPDAFYGNKGAFKAKDSDASIPLQAMEQIGTPEGDAALASNCLSFEEAMARHLLVLQAFSPLIGTGTRDTRTVDYAKEFHAAYPMAYLSTAFGVEIRDFTTHVLWPYFVTLNTNHDKTEQTILARIQQQPHLMQLMHYMCGDNLPFEFQGNPAEHPERFVPDSVRPGRFFDKLCYKNYCKFMIKQIYLSADIALQALNPTQAGDTIKYIMQQKGWGLGAFAYKNPPEMNFILETLFTEALSEVLTDLQGRSPLQAIGTVNCINLPTLWSERDVPFNASRPKVLPNPPTGIQVFETKMDPCQRIENSPLPHSEIIVTPVAADALSALGNEYHTIASKIAKLDIAKKIAEIISTSLRKRKIPMDEKVEKEIIKLLEKTLAKPTRGAVDRNSSDDIAAVLALIKYDLLYPRQMPIYVILQNPARKVSLAEYWHLPREERLVKDNPSASVGTTEQPVRADDTSSPAKPAAVPVRQSMPLPATPSAAEPSVKAPVQKPITTGVATPPEETEWETVEVEAIRESMKQAMQSPPATATTAAAKPAATTPTTSMAAPLGNQAPIAAIPVAPGTLFQGPAMPPPAARATTPPASATTTAATKPAAPASDPKSSITPPPPATAVKPAAPAAKPMSALAQWKAREAAQAQQQARPTGAPPAPRTDLLAGAKPVTALMQAGQLPEPPKR